MIAIAINKEYLTCTVKKKLSMRFNYFQCSFTSILVWFYLLEWSGRECKWRLPPSLTGQTKGSGCSSLENINWTSEIIELVKLLELNKHFSSTSFSLKDFDSFDRNSPGFMWSAAFWHGVSSRKRLCYALAATPYRVCYAVVINRSSSSPLRRPP